MNNTTTFETAKVGDKVWFLATRKWGTIAEVYPELPYPIEVHFDGRDRVTFTVCGRECKSHRFQTLFWDEIPIIAPPKPLPKMEVDTKVLVWDTGKRLRIKRYFSHFDADGKIYVFAGGSTSWTNNGSTTTFDRWELAN